MNKKLDVLISIAEVLNRNSIRWALGASCMLYLRGIVNDFHDIDLLIDEDDSAKAIAALKTLGTMRDPESSSAFQTVCFRQFVIQNVEVDMIAGMAIVCDHAVHRFRLSDDSIDCTLHIQNQDIPLQSTAAWREYYALMGRTEKVRIIDESEAMQKAKDASHI